MKYNQIFSRLACAALCMSIWFSTSCSDEFNVGNPIDKSDYAGVSSPKVCIRDSADRAGFTVVEIDDSTIPVEFNLELTRAVDFAVSAQFLSADETAVSDYNARHGTSYTIYPLEKVTLPAEAVTIAAGQTASSEIVLQLAADASISNQVDYAVPLKVVSQTVGVLDGDIHMLIVKNMRGKKVASADKASGIKLFSCMEVGMSNPLFHTSFMLKNSGKPLFDCVVLFSGHIVFDLETQRVRFRPSTGQSAIIADYDKYIKPLHDLGIKVIFSILGSNEGAISAGIAHMDDATARYFAGEIADFCRAYKLDGVFFDDEYTGPVSAPGLGPSSKAKMARLCYETKMAMPDKWVVAYIYGTLTSLPAVDGVQPGSFVDYALNDYGATIGISAYPGMTNSQLGVYSTNWSPGYWRNYGTSTYLNQVRSGGYGAYMGYCLDFQTSTWSQQLTQLKNIAQYLYDDELVDLGYRPGPEW